MTIRPARESDLAAINSIYNHYVLNSTCTYQEEPSTDEERLAWFRNRGEAHPVLVAELGGEVVGWASLSPFRDRSAYRHSVEASIYIRRDRQRLGIGKALLVDLIERARALGHRTIIGGASAEQEASIRLQESLGFQKVGHFREIGRKFDRWLDVAFYQLMLERPCSPPASS
jgi:L-amino acid N-acyltransferase YncA